MDILSLSGLVTLLHELGVHILGYHASHASETVLDITKTFLTKEGKPINHHLQRAARRSFLATQQIIAQNCHKELIAESPVQKSLGQLVYLPPHREELKWLDTKVKETAKELGQLQRDKTVADEFVNRDDLESLCTPEGKLAEAQIIALKQRLIEEALTDCHSRCYQYKVETELFEQVSNRFMAAIRENPEVSRVFNARWLAQISALGQEVKQKVERLEEQMSLLFSIVLKLDGSVENLNNVVLAKILKELQQLTKDSSIKIDRMRDGSVILVLQGSRQGIGQLRTLFKTGQLKELSGIRVLDVSSEWEDEKPAHVNRPISYDLMRTVTKLAAWLQKIFSGSRVLEWEDEKPAHVNRPISYDPMRTVTKLAAWLQENFSEEWLPVGKLALAPARAHRAHKEDDIKRTERGIQINLGEDATQTVILVVTVRQSQEDIDVALWFYPVKGSVHLPSGLRILVLDKDGNPEEELSMVVKGGQEAAKLSLSRAPGERFAVKLALGEKDMVKKFEV
jgi:hypothetical protein